MIEIRHIIKPAGIDILSTRSTREMSRYPPSLSPYNLIFITNDATCLHVAFRRRHGLCQHEDEPHLRSTSVHPSLCRSFR